MGDGLPAMTSCRDRSRREHQRTWAWLTSSLAIAVSSATAAIASRRPDVRQSATRKIGNSGRRDETYAFFWHLRVILKSDKLVPEERSDSIDRIQLIRIHVNGGIAPDGDRPPPSGKRGH